MLDAIRNTPGISSVELDPTYNTVELHQGNQPLSTTELQELEGFVAVNYPHLLDASICRVVIVEQPAA